MRESEKINSNIKGWIGVVCTLMPVIKIASSFFGLGHLTEILDQAISVGCGAVGVTGTYLLAKAEPLKKK